jgi:hypothetical protein
VRPRRQRRAVLDDLRAPAPDHAALTGRIGETFVVLVGAGQWLGTIIEARCGARLEPELAMHSFISP